MSVTTELIRDAVVDPGEHTSRKSIIKPYVMSHGTLECRDMKETRKFYEEFLGLECVRHAIPAMVFRCGIKFHVVAVEVGDKIKPVSLLNHWGVDVETKEKVDEAYDNALKYKDKYKIRQVLKPVMQHGVYSFYMEDLDHNWWEVQTTPGFVHDDLFDFGDRFSMEDGTKIGELKELSVKNAD